MILLVKFFSISKRDFTIADRTRVEARRTFHDESSANAYTS